MRRKLAITAGLLLLFVAILCATALWLGGRESTLRWLAEQATQHSGGALEVSGVSGSLYRRIDISRLVYRDAKRDLALHDVALIWSPRALLDRQLVIETLNVQSASLELRSVEDTPPELPQSLSAPLDLVLRELKVGELLITRQAFKTRLQNIALVLEGGRETWRARLIALTSQWGDAQGVLDVGVQRPFPLEANVRLTQLNAPAYSATAALTGSLAELAANVSGKVQGAAIDARLALAPFTETPLATIDLTAQDIALQAFREGLPAANLEVRLSARGLAGNQYAGEVLLRNSSAGKIDQNRLPVREIKSGFTGDASILELPALHLDLEEAGRLSGKGSWRDQQFNLALSTSNLNLRGLHGKLNATALAGNIALAADARSQSLQANLQQDSYRFGIDAALAERVVKVRELSAHAGEGMLTARGELALAGDRDFSIDGELKRFDPAQFGDYPKALINSRFTAAGALEPNLKVAGELEIHDSRVLGERLSASAKLATNAQTIEASNVVINLGKSKIDFNGSIGMAGDQPFRAKGKLTRVNPADFGDYPRGLINSRFDLAGALAPQWKAAGDLTVYDSTLFDQALSARAKLRTTGQTITGSDIVVNLGKSKVELDGNVATSSDHAFRVKGKVARINPARFGDYPRGLINGDFAATGKIAPQAEVTATFSVHDSSIIDQGMSAKGHLSASRNRIADADVTINAGRNRVEFDGAFGAPADKLVWSIGAPELAIFGKDFAGSLNAKGSLAGTFKAPSVEFNGSAKNLMLFGDYRIEQFSGTGKLAAGVSGTFAADAQASGIQTPRISLSKASAALTGEASDHRLAISAVNRDIDLETTLAGAWSEVEGWRGQVREFVNRGTYPAKLQAPAKLAFGNERFSLRDATVAFADGVFNVEVLEKKGARLASRGRASGFPASYLLALTAGDLPIASNLLLGANWDIAADQNVNGKLRIWREKGDLTVTAEPRTALGLGQIEVDADIEANRVNASLSARSEPLGWLNAKAATTISERDGVWGIAGAAPLSLQANAAIPSLSWLQPFLQQPGIALDGALAFKLAADGTVAEPNLTGTVTGDKLALQLPEYGVNIGKGSLHADFAGQQLLIRELILHAGDGLMQAEGTAAWRGGKPSMQLTAQLSKFLALDRAERQLAVSGAGKVALNENKLEIDAKLTADRGLIILPKQEAPTLSDDIVIVGAPAGSDAKKTEPLRANIDVNFDLGNDFTLRGKGLESQLTGAIHFVALPDKPPTATGRIQASGSYEAYNQQLTIQRGVLTFTGPIGNPTLDILAVRKVPELDQDAVEAGVAITGTAIAPRAKLVSTPNVPDAEKLSWLVSGHGGGDAGGADVLAAAAGGLLTGDGPTLQSQIASATGLDEVAVRSSGGIEKSVLALGKRLSSRVYVNYEQSLTGAASLVKINYALTRRWSVRGTAGGDNAVDLFYSFSFD